MADSRRVEKFKIAISPHISAITMKFCAVSYGASLQPINS